MVKYFNNSVYLLFVVYNRFLFPPFLVFIHCFAWYSVIIDNDDDNVGGIDGVGGGDSDFDNRFDIFIYRCP